MQVEECVIANETITTASADDSPWSGIVMDDAIKDQIRNHALLALTLRQQMPFASTGLHGQIVLHGPPGTGKTSLARGLPFQLAPYVTGRRVRRIEINPHGLMSGEHGKSQQQVHELLSDYIPGLADDGQPTVVVLDEVESMVVARSEASLGANPADVHRATGAVLTALDTNTRKCPHLLFVATSNFMAGLDEAFMSRADAAILVPAPNQQALAAIIRSTLHELGALYPALRTLAEDPALPEVAARLDGLDGRMARKFVIGSLASATATTVDPAKLTMRQLLAAADVVDAAGAAS
ncbi:hypothetical protein GCM10023153_31430 [Ornithinibacter aureus]|uniref:AAA+ ATPase domain-containing protein n=1 Tax=Ornithinibacter aureus TaxID=622664 RepID=A0ABP8K9F1_9MICO|nr:AAA family ATPase [Ornithinibacter aureus]KAF0833906.1 ATPase family protein associated with various cellular activities (AAA) [Ornithinibacter aureus]